MSVIIKMLSYVLSVIYGRMQSAWERPNRRSSTIWTILIWTGTCSLCSLPFNTTSDTDFTDFIGEMDLEVHNLSTQPTTNFEANNNCEHANEEPINLWENSIVDERQANPSEVCIMSSQYQCIQNKFDELKMLNEKVKSVCFDNIWDENR